MAHFVCWTEEFKPSVRWRLHYLLEDQFRLSEWASEQASKREREIERERERTCRCKIKLYQPQCMKLWSGWLQNVANKWAALWWVGETAVFYWAPTLAIYMSVEQVIDFIQHVQCMYAVQLHAQALSDCVIINYVHDRRLNSCLGQMSEWLSENQELLLRARDFIHIVFLNWGSSRRTG